MSNNKSVPDYVDDPGQVGNKIWRLVPDNGIKVTKSTSSGVDTYKFEADLSEEKGNVAQVMEDGLYVPEVTSKVEELTKDIEKLRDEITKLKSTEYRPTESVTFDTGESDNGIPTISARVNVSSEKDNCIEVKPDGLFSRSMDVTPGSIADIEKRLTKLEEELLVLTQDIDNLKTTANIDKSGNVTPPVVVPDSAK